jgi:hypothetical protein
MTMAASTIDPRTEGALAELFAARARFLDRFGNDVTSRAVWSRALRALSSYQATTEVKQKILQGQPIDEKIVAEIESRWICEYRVDPE